MNVSEVHIQLAQAFDSIASEQFDSLISEEKDLWLHKAQNAFIKERVKPQPTWQKTFQGSKPQYDNLQNLVSSINVPLYVHDDKTLKGQLPNDYFMAIGERVKVAPCLEELPNTFDPQRQVVYYKFIDDDRSISSNYWSDLKIDLFRGVAETIYDSTIFPSYENGVDHKELSYFIIKHFIERQNIIDLNDINVYWEWFDGIHRENTIIIEIVNKFDWISLVSYLDGVIKQTDPIQDYESLQYDIDALNEYDSWQECRLVKHEELFNMLSNEFYTTTPDSPIVTIRESVIYVHHDATFIPTELNLTYLRRPKRFDHIAEQSFEVDEPFHYDIVDKCVEMLTAAINADTHRVIKVNNQTNK